MKTLHAILNILSYIFFLFVILAVFFTITSNGQFLGSYQSFLVKSGSMEPTVMTGDIIIVQEQSSYTKNDVVTFKDTGERIVTHRIIEETKKNDATVFITKGDANRSVDNDTIAPEAIIGKVTLVVPKVGFLVGFTQTLPGLITMIIIPATLLILDQIVKMSLKKTRRLHV